MKFDRRYWVKLVRYWFSVLIWPSFWLLVAAFALWHSWTFEKCIHEIPNGITHQNYGYGLPFFFAWPIEGIGCLGPFVDANSDSILAAFTVILAVSTIFLWRVTDKAVRESRRIGEIQVRGYLSFAIDKVDVDPLTDGDEPRCEVNVTGKILNTGQTPTYGARICYEIDVAAKHGVQGFSADGSDLFESKPVAYAIASQGNTKQSARKKLSVRSSDITSGKLVVRFTYLIKYTDVFGEENITPICDGYFQRRQGGGLDFIAGQIERIEN